MKHTVFSRRLVILLTTLLIFQAGQATAKTAQEQAAPEKAGLEKALALNQEGHFVEAEAVFREVILKDPASFQAALSLGALCLLRNDLRESEVWLRKALDLKKDARAPLAMLAELHYRRGDFAAAARLFEALGEMPQAEKLKRLAASPAYVIVGDAERTVVPFLQTDPLPLVKMRVNGGEEAVFLIDTGGWELILFEPFAEKLGVEQLGSQLGTFAGGRQATTYQGVVSSVEIGDFIVKNVPVSITAGRGISAMFGREISGILGTVFLYHFLFTLDYPGGNLVLEKLTAENSERLKKETAGPDWVRMPFWMAGDHFMTAWGAINGRPTLLFIDTGMAGGGFTCSERMLKEAGIALPEASATGTGGGGQIQVKIIQADLALGEARESNVGGFFGAFPPGFETRLGFKMDGLISHGFFRPYKVVFDFLTMTLSLRKTT